MKRLILLVLTSALILFSASSIRKTRQEFVFIPMGSASINGKNVSVDAFWIYNTEVSNREYKEFLDWLEKEGKEEDLKTALIHGDNWKNTNSFNDPYAKHYHTHPAYDEYPVVNITHAAAKLFCKWLSRNLPEGEPVYRLPLKEELIYAAMGGFDLTPYPWGSPYLRNEKGQIMCNYRVIGDERIHTEENGEEVILSWEETRRVMPSIASGKGVANSTITAPVLSYYPNEYGLYNTSGNVAEMVDEPGIAVGGSFMSTGFDVRVNSVSRYDSSSVLVGFRPVRDYFGSK